MLSVFVEVAVVGSGLPTVEHLEQARLYSVDTSLLSATNNVSVVKDSQSTDVPHVGPGM